MADERASSSLLSRAEANLELLATILLAVAAVATAWSSYQSARWSGVQTIAFSEANAARVESTRASDEAGQQRQIDIVTFAQWANAYAEENATLENFYVERFRPEFRPAVEAWVATRPLRSDDAPPTPFAMPEYRLARDADAAGLLRESERSAAEAREANQRSDNYVLTVVLFSAALFFAGISTKLGASRQRLAVLGLGYLTFMGALGWVLTFPVTVAV